MNKRLLIVIWNMGPGGVQKRLNDILEDINQNYRNWNVNLLIQYEGQNSDLTRLQSLQNVKIFTFKSYRTQAKTIFFVFWIMMKFLEFRPHVCLTFSDYLTIIMVNIRAIFFWHKTKLVINEAALTSRFLEINRTPIWKTLVKVFYKYVDRIIVPSEACKQDLIHNFNIRASSIFVIPNWTMFQIPRKYLKPTYDLLFIGRLEQEKNPILFLEIINSIRQLYPDIRSCLVGDGKLMPDVLNYIHNHSLQSHVRVVGFQKNVVQYLTKTKLLVVPSLNEGVPNVVIEAAVYAVPSVVCNFPGSEEVVIDGNTGYIGVSEAEMTKRVAELLRNRRKCKIFGTNAQKYILQRFSSKNQNNFISLLFQDP